MGNKYMLITVVERDIYTELFDSLEEAQATMRMELFRLGLVSEDILGLEEYDDGECGFGDDCGYVNDGFNHQNCDWRIVAIGGGDVEEG